MKKKRIFNDVRRDDNNKTVPFYILFIYWSQENILVDLSPLWTHEMPMQFKIELLTRVIYVQPLVYHGSSDIDEGKINIWKKKQNENEYSLDLERNLYVSTSL